MLMHPSLPSEVCQCTQIPLTLNEDQNVVISLEVKSQDLFCKGNSIGVLEKSHI